MTDVNKPILRFEGFEEDWEKFMLSELLDLGQYLGQFLVETIRAN